MRAVYYCRVSTEEETQVNALSSQIDEAKNCIESNSWIEIDGYVDEGKSGTVTTKRNAYNRLVADMETDKFDVIVIKSQDRLMRNTRDWYLFIDKLVTYNKKLYFYLDQKFYTPDDALITGIKAILAEEYSRDLSKKINNAHRNRQKNGNSVIITSKTWGYDKVNKQVVINEKEAEIVRLIYDLSAQGYGSRSISKELSNRGIKSRTGNDFPEATVRRIIRNPLFKGTVIMNQRKKDFNTKKTIRTPESEWIYHEDIVPAIVSKETWEKANKMMDAKSQEVHTNEFKDKTIGKNIGKFDLSSKIVCGQCDSTYWRRYRKLTKGEQVVEWSCSEYIKRGRKHIQDSRGKDKIKIKSHDGGCDNIHIKEEDLNNLLIQIAKQNFSINNTETKELLLYTLRSVFDSDEANAQLSKIRLEKNKVINQKDLLLDKLLEGIITDDDYKRRDLDLEEKCNALERQENGILENMKLFQPMENRILDVISFFKKERDFDALLKKMMEHVEKIIIHADKTIDVKLDIMKTFSAKIEKSAKKNQYVDTTKYLTTIDDQIP